VIYQWKKLSVQIRQQTQETPDSHQDEVTRLQQLRQSCIAGWIREHGIRKAQYMGGFRTVSGVERYRDEYLEDLQKLLIEFHPLK
jgi:cobalamin-dependent methionine synthase I